MRKPLAPHHCPGRSHEKGGIHFPFLWMVVGDFVQKFMAKNIITGEIKMVDKE